MQKETKDLFSKIIIRQYLLPNAKRNINKSNISNLPDHCLSCVDNDLLSELIGKSLIDYCFDEEEQQNKDVKTLLNTALKIRVKVRLEAKTESTLLKQGFFGEAFLYSVLVSYFGADTLSCRGRLFNPLSKGESPGYDSFHMIENVNSIDLWFGEAKFYNSYQEAIKSIVASMRHSLSTEYLHTNLMAVLNHDKYIRNVRITNILKNWKEHGFVITLDELIHKENIKLVYPALMIYDDNKLDYDEIIKKSIQKINEETTNTNINVPDFCSVFFVLLPVSDARKIKLDVIEWINKKQN